MIRNDTPNSDFDDVGRRLWRRIATHVSAVLPAVPNNARAVPANAKWIGAGFLAGILFWHAVGFWTFMNRVVFESPQTAAHDRLTTADIETGSIRPLHKRTVNPGIEPSCTALVRSKDGVTQPIACKPLSQPLKHTSPRGRGDYLVVKSRAPSPAVNDWTTVLEPIKDAKLHLP